MLSTWVQYGRILVPKVVKTKHKQMCFPEMTQKGLDKVRIASGSPGNCFLYQNDVFLYQQKQNMFSHYLIPIFPVEFLISGLLNWIPYIVDWRWSGLEKKMKWIGLEWRKGGEIGEKSCPQTHFLTTTHKTPFQNKKNNTDVLCLFVLGGGPCGDTPSALIGVLVF